ncbi:MAG: Slp family lipoprotein [Syntrophobacteraceae bacterium]
MVSLLVLWGALTGCAHVISYDLREKARGDLSFSAVLQNPDSYRDETVVWGGKIIETVNLEGSTEIKVLQMPLDYYGMPISEELTAGRFIARATGYLDNQIYRTGRWLTVGGQIVGLETQPLGERQYTYPVVAVKEIHLWVEPRYPYYYRDYPYWHGYGYPYWYGAPYPFHNPFWPYYPYPYGW